MASKYTLKIKNHLGINQNDKTRPSYTKSTETEGWHLVVTEDLGRLRWIYVNDKEDRKARPQDATTKFFLDLSIGIPDSGPPKSAAEAIYKGTRFQANTQIRDLGCWGADLSCIFFVTPMMVIAWYITGAEIDEAYVIELIQFMFDCQRTDGGWQPVYLPCWAKFWLALLGLYDWEGTDPYPVEMWLLPEWLPVSPWQWFIIPRHVYLAMCFFSSKRFTVPTNDVLDEIRAELFPDDFSSVNFSAFEGVVLASKRHQAKGWVLQTLNWTLKAHAERATTSTGIVSLDGWLNMIAFYCAEGPDSPALKRMQETSLEYLWMGSSGMQTMSIHGGHMWDTSFALQSLVYTGLANHPDFHGNARHAYEFLIKQQLVEEWEDCPSCHYPSRLGAWSFTARYHGIPCSDCTAEALKAILLLEKETSLREMSEKNLHLAVDQLLYIQNASGGYSSFEPIGAGEWLEHLNGTEMFGQVMTEHDYVECTSSCITALDLFRDRKSGYRSKEVDDAIERGVQYVERSQKEDGSWMASWGITFTYGAFFAMEALHCGGRSYKNSPVVREGCRFLFDMQESDGGSRMSGSYVRALRSHTVQTAWSCLALMYAGYPDPEPIKRGLDLIWNRQKPNGEWEQEYSVGCGIVTCHIKYYYYIYSFPLRALAMYEKIYGEGLPW
ncbi:hypothetical protein ABOM_005526 [Aspergillus bombycis]|uniref:Terpene cyclase/mutase family member n=1 Tax=Aspergillus bombycis TaxID=109264 RepID=A0A1F8A269_9EURO|nr:hypothetical protein ABOM_005526 [Aspergillus bombycis]OGM45820.1 hypothetical protein ABOM_005526 [Aspergillus bombycis]